VLCSSTSVPSAKYLDNLRAGHPGWRRCSSLKYSGYSRSSRLAVEGPNRAPRSGILSTYFALGTLACGEDPSRDVADDVLGDVPGDLVLCGKARPGAGDEQVIERSG
jgi:hypothetical protein